MTSSTSVIAIEARQPIPNPMLTPEVLHGGSATRLWSLNRKSFLKQFVPFIGNKSLLQLTLKRVSLLSKNAMGVILGVSPDRPETEYGDIQIDYANTNFGARAVKRFVERQNEIIPSTYLAEDGYYWSAAMLNVSVWLKVPEHFRPDIFKATTVSDA